MGLIHVHNVDRRRLLQLQKVYILDESDPKEHEIEHKYRFDVVFNRTRGSEVDIYRVEVEKEQGQLAEFQQAVLIPVGHKDHKVEPIHTTNLTNYNTTFSNNNNITTISNNNNITVSNNNNVTTVGELMNRFIDMDIK